MCEFFYWLSNIAAVIAIFTFIYAIWIERKIERFKKRVLFNTRLEHLLNDLKEENSSLSKLHEDIEEESIDLKTTFWKIESILSDIKPKLPQNLQPSVDKLKSAFFSKKNVKFVSGEKPEKEWWRIFTIYYNEDDMQELYAQVDSLMYRIDNSIKDNKILP